MHDPDTNPLTKIQNARKLENQMKFISSSHSSSFSKYFQVMRKNWEKISCLVLKARNISPGIYVLKWKC
jgi:hypothetical protein